MLLGARQFFERRGAPLPYDAEVEYLRNTGLTQWIDTGVVFSGTLRIIAKFTPRQRASDKWALASWNANARIYAVYQYPLGGYGAGYGSYYSGLSPMQMDETVDLEIEFTATHQILVIDGVEASRREKSAFTGTVTNSLWLFNLNDGTNGAKGFLCDFGRVQMYVGENLVRDFAPVRFTNEQNQSEGAMYDRLGVGGMNPDGSPRTDGLYRNRGTGAFTTGPDKS